MPADPALFDGIAARMAVLGGRMTNGAVPSLPVTAARAGGDGGA
jgi:hypothetical protein